MFSIFGRLSARLASIPYALVGLFARIVVAWPFLISGQGKVEGGNILPEAVVKLGRDLFGWELSYKLPEAVSQRTFELFANEYKLPILPSNAAAYIVAFAEIVFPLLILFGLMTRISALCLFIMVLVIQFLVVPGNWWTQHAYWLALLAVLMSRGPGAISLDAFFGLFRRKPKMAHAAPRTSEPEIMAPAVKA
jgi:putative oxidoreductase